MPGASRSYAQRPPSRCGHLAQTITLTVRGSTRRIAANPYGIRCQLGAPPTERPLLADCEQLVEPREAERRLRASLPEWQRHWTSDDYVEMSWYAPTARLYIARPVLAPLPGGRGIPDWATNTLGGIPATIDPTVECAAKVVAGTLLDVLSEPGLVASARAEFERRTGGDAYVAPLLPADFSAPIELPWPEYVTTARGPGWVNPYPG